MNVKYACFADTPLHVLNCVNFVYHNVEGSRRNCDLYLHKQFSGYNDMLIALRESNIFNRVIECNLPIKRDEGRIQHAVVRTLELFQSKKCLMRWTNGLFNNEKYEVILMPAPMRFTVALYDRNKSAKVWFYEDGSGSYFGNILDAYGPKYKHFFNVVFHKGHETIMPERMYVNNVSMCKSTTPCSIMQLPKFDMNETEYQKLLKRVFANEKGECTKRNVYLSVPIEEVICDEGKIAENILNQTLFPLEQYKDRIIVRPHPREKVREYSNLNIDTSRSLWELFCATNIDDSSLLIGLVSTAQMTPKLLYDREPFLIFTYKLYSSPETNKRQIALDSFIDNLISSYKDPSKIIVARTIEEYTEAVESFFKR